MPKLPSNTKSLLNRDEPAEFSAESEAAPELVQRRTTTAEESQQLKRIEGILMQIVACPRRETGFLPRHTDERHAGTGREQDRVHRLHQGTMMLREMDPQNATRDQFRKGVTCAGE